MAGPRSTFRIIRQEEETNRAFGNSGHFRTELLSGLQTAPLTIPIHKLFCREAFDNSEVEYDSLIAAFQLVSALINVGLPFFHAILIGDFQQIDASDGRPSYCFAEPLETLTDAQVSATWTMIDKLADWTNFHLEQKYNSCSSCETKERVDRIASDRNGAPSLIRIGRPSWQPVVDSHNSGDIVKEQSSAFELACHLVHELTHAAFFAAVPKDLHEANFYVGEGVTTELGFEMEAYIFSGVIHQRGPFNENSFFYTDRASWSSFQELILFRDYPCPAMVCRYDAEDDDDQIFTRGTLERRCKIVWNASFLYIHRLFSDRFWHNEFFQHGRKALRFERETGYRFEIEFGKSRVPWQPRLPDTDVPDGFYANEHGLLIKNGQIVELPDED